MLSRFLKNLSILKKFLFINFLVFLIIGLLTLIYLNRIQPTLIKTKTVNHINTLDNTIENLNRLQVQFNEEEVKSFLFSTRFLFQSLDRVQFFDLNFNLIGDTDTLDLDPRAFSQRLDIVEMNNLNENEQNNKPEKKEENLKKKVKILENLNIYKSSKNFSDKNRIDFSLIIKIHLLTTQAIILFRSIIFEENSFFLANFLCLHLFDFFLDLLIFLVAYLKLNLLERL